jgi:hypothetical protein
VELSQYLVKYKAIMAYKGVAAQLKAFYHHMVSDQLHATTSVPHRRSLCYPEPVWMLRT